MISDRLLGPLYAQNQVIETCSVQPLQSSCSVVAISEVNEGKALLQCQISSFVTGRGWKSNLPLIGLEES